MLTNIQCKNAKPREKPYKLKDVPGLFLLIKPNGTKTWLYRYKNTLDGSSRDHSYNLGKYVAMVPNGESDAEAQERCMGAGARLTLQEARRELDKARGLVLRGINPAHKRRGERIAQQIEATITVEKLGREWVASRLWEDITKRRRLDMLRRVVFRDLGCLPVKSVQPPQVLAVLNKAREQNGPSVAAEAQRTLRNIFDHGIATLRVDKNPLAPLGRALPPNKTQHKRALLREEVGQVLSDFETKWEGKHQTVAAFLLMWWTLCRPGEVTGARWNEIDLEERLWRIPAERMKMRREHVVPLPQQAVAMLRTIKLITGHLAHVFPHRDQRDQGMTEATMRSVLHQIGWSGKYSPHATRTTGSTLLNDLEYNPDWIERQLAHSPSNRVRGTYNHAQYLEQRAKMMQTWANLLDEWKATAAGVARCEPLPRVA